MRTSKLTTTAEAANNAATENEPTVFYDAHFRDVKERIVAPPSFPQGARFADTHTHLDMLKHPELALARCAAHNVNLIITVIDPTEKPTYTCENLDDWLSKAGVLLAEFACEKDAQLAAPSENDQPVMPSENTQPTSLSKNTQPSLPTLPEVRLIAGCHPHNASQYNASIEQALLDTLKDPRACGLGEIGLDYHYDRSPRTTQQKVFRRQLELAHELKLPVALHLREAHSDGLAILKEIGMPPAGTLLHCFNLDYATLEPFLELGCLVAFGGPLTFKKSDEVRDAARRTPQIKIVTETDAPFMAPHPVRGVTCGPEHVIYTAARLAECFTATETPSETPALDATKALALYEQIFQNANHFFAPRS
ncbi:MAG: TatD family hydrolase [Coriobacteriales bacterium]|jgi:TatD DNase family protein|nr:TatD family hydrolase [Coriobacteriales bacterium]